MTFVHTHVHTENSLMDGLNHSRELLEVAKAQGQPALAITDHGTLAGHRNFQKEAADLGIKPILGVEAYISPTDRFDRRDVRKRDDNTQLYNHVILLAKNNEGLRNLRLMNQTAWTEGYYYKPRIDKELLSMHKQGIIVLSGCLNGLIAKAIERDDLDLARAWVEWFAKEFNENFYIEVQAHNGYGMNSFLLGFADEYGIPVVATSDAHFSRPEERETEEALLIIATNPPLNREASFEQARGMDEMAKFDYLYPNRPISFTDLNLYIASRDELVTDFKEVGVDRSDIFDNTLLIADAVEEYDYPKGLDLLPRPKGVDPDEILRRKCREGMRRRKLSNRPEYEARLEEELEVITSKNFSTYFLIVEDMISWAKSQGILVGPGRGSAAGSLVCYTLGITEVDPIKFGLLFFRFINPERNDFPDIDTDFEDRRRGEVKEYLRHKFLNVASISVFSTFQGKNSIRDAARVYQIPIAEVNKALKGIDAPANRDYFELWASSPQGESFSKKYPEVPKLAKKLHKRIRSTGMHAAGVVIANQPIINFAPIETAKDPNSKNTERLPVVALDMEQVADIGLIKLDALGLKTLAVIADTLRSIEQRTGTKVNLLEIGLDDKNVYSMLSNGFTKGVFQAEAVPYTNLLVRMGVSNFDDLAVSNALVRPGAMNTIGATYLARKQGREATNYLHPLLEPFTKETYGLILYQEQVMLACTELGGMKMTDADKVRKIIGKKKDVKEFEAFKGMFVEGASRYVDKAVAEDLWHDFEAHADYSFNKSHAVAYSMLSYWTAWLKFHYPLEFMLALLANEKDKDARTEYLIEAKRLRLEVKLPHVNYSAHDYSLTEDAIRFGLTSIKYISDKMADKLIAMRPFDSYADLESKVMAKGSGVTSRQLDALNKVGAAVFPDNPPTGEESKYLYEYLGIPKFDISEVTPWIRSQLTALEDYEESGTFIVMGMVKGIKRGAGWARIELLDETGSAGIFTNENTEIEVGQMYIILAGDNRVADYVSVNELRGSDKIFVRWLGKPSLNIEHDQYVVISFQTVRTKAGKLMAHMVVSDKDKNLKKVLVFSKNYAKALGFCGEGQVVKLSLRRTQDDTLYLHDVSR